VARSVAQGPRRAARALAPVAAGSLQVARRGQAFLPLVRPVLQALLVAAGARLQAVVPEGLPPSVARFPASSQAPPLARVLRQA